jgi:hypothetical protein
MGTQLTAPLYFAVFINAQGNIGANIDTVSAMIAEAHGIGVMAGLALKITTLEKDYQPVSRSIDAGKRQNFINDCLLRVHG